MNETRLGSLVSKNAERDAIHIAVCPCKAGEQLRAGQHVNVVDGVAKATKDKPIGIVDPFLKNDVEVDQWFYVCLYPGSITSLRHQWTHPAFSKVVIDPYINGESVAWLMNFASRASKSYDEVLEIAKTALESGMGCHVGGNSNSELFNDNKRPFLKHASIVLGKITPDYLEDFYFSCSC